jgi:peptide/nickel transport system ATP-binding protein
MSEANHPALIRASGLFRRYRSRAGFLGRSAEFAAVNGVSLAVQRGETLGIVGESGSGKSTLGRLVLGLEPASAGDVWVEGARMPPERSADWRQLRRRMQLIQQDPLGALDRRLNIADQVREPLDIHGVGDRASRDAATQAMLDRMGLSRDYASRYPHELSGGQRQRVVLARALMTRPDFVVCDEPVSALDVSIQAQVVNLLVDLQSEFGLAMLFISHDLRVVRQVSHRILVMYLGEIVEEGSADDLFSSPLHPYTQALVSAAPGAAKRCARIILTGDPPNPADRPSGCAFHPRCPLANARCRVEPPRAVRAEEGRIVRCHLVAGETIEAEERAA